MGGYNSGKSYLPGEIDRIRDLIRQGKSNVEIGRYLGHPRESIRQIRIRLMNCQEANKTIAHADGQVNAQVIACGIAPEEALC